MTILKTIVFIILLVANAKAQESYFAKDISQIEQKIIDWRRDFHQHPELGNQEFRTAKIIAEHLESLGIEVQTNVAKTGVVGLLRGGKPGPTVGLRADMDALPITERTNVPFKSTVKVNYKGTETGVMHACGHDSHVAILMGTAEILAKHKKEIAGNVKFIFQPAEEGVFGEGIKFGADLMVIEGVLKKPDVDAIFGLHINSQTPSGQILYRSGATMAGVDQFYITVKGKQTHGAYPWFGIDPVLTASQIVQALNTIVSRNVVLIDNPAVVSVGSIHGGNRHNIIPEDVKMIGTIRTLDIKQRKMIHERIKTIATKIAESNGAEAEVFIEEGYPVTSNDAQLTALMLPSLKAAAGEENVKVRHPVMGAEDFSFFAREVPGLFFFLGAMDNEKKDTEVSAHHTPYFYLNEDNFEVGVQAFVNLVMDYIKLH